MLSINPSELIWTILSFFALLFLLNRFLYKPLVRFMDERRARIDAGLNEEAAALSAEIQALREERDTLRVEYAETVETARPARPESVPLGMEIRDGQAAYVTAPVADKATVLGVRRGQSASYIWNSVIDTLGECFH